MRTMSELRFELQLCRTPWRMRNFYVSDMPHGAEKGMGVTFAIAVYTSMCRYLNKLQHIKHLFATWTKFVQNVTERKKSEN